MSFRFCTVRFVLAGAGALPFVDDIWSHPTTVLVRFGYHCRDALFGCCSFFDSSQMCAPVYQYFAEVFSESGK
jgi:hypothetical protein